MPQKSIKYDNVIDKIDAITSIIKQKENNHFNNIIKALANGDFPAFSKSTNNLNELRLIEVRLAEIRAQQRNLKEEVEGIAAQIDTL